MEPAPFIIVWVITLFLISVFKKSARIITHTHVCIVERLGRYNRTLLPGLHFIVPWVEETRKVNWRFIEVSPRSNEVHVKKMTTDKIDLRECVLDMAHQQIITKDNVQLELDSILYFRILDPQACVLRVQNLPDSLELLVKSTLRNIMSSLTLDDTFASREKISTELREKCTRDCQRWGCQIERVELQNIILNIKVSQAMESQIKESNERKSTILEAAGTKESRIIRSLGISAKKILDADCQRASAINRAQGEAEAKLAIATANATSINRLRDILDEVGSTILTAPDYLMSLQYIGALKRLSGAGKTKLVLIPSDSNDFVQEVMKHNPLK
ncbi:hypothetical protein PCE1_003914 [Barthelona sp. PCE]